MTDKQIRGELIAKRDQLYWRFLKTPVEIHLAIEIKGFDNQIAEITERMRVEEKKAVQRDRNNARTHK